MEWFIVYVLIILQLFPDKACIKIAAIEDEEYKDHKFNFWNDVEIVLL